MKTLFILLMLLAFDVTAQTSMILPIIEVYDGDTIKTRMTLPPPLNKVSVRIIGIDTPEMPAKSYHETGKLGRAKCVKEAELAIQAKLFVVDLATQYELMEVTDFEYGKFGGRILGNVFIGDFNIAEELIERNLAVPYFGKKKSKDWCK